MRAARRPGMVMVMGARLRLLGPRVAPCGPPAGWCGRLASVRAERAAVAKCVRTLVRCAVRARGRLPPRLMARLPWSRTCATRCPGRSPARLAGRVLLRSLAIRLDLAGSALPARQPAHPARGRPDGRRLGRRPARAQHRRSHGLGDRALRGIDHRAQRGLAGRRRRAHGGRDRDARLAPRHPPLADRVRSLRLWSAGRPGRLQPQRRAHRADLPGGGQPGRGLAGRGGGLHGRPVRRRRTPGSAPAGTACWRCTSRSASAAATASSRWPSSTCRRARSTSRSREARRTTWLLVTLAIVALGGAALRHRQARQRHHPAPGDGARPAGRRADRAARGERRP